MNSKTIAVALVALIAALLCASQAAAASSRKLLFPHPFLDHHPFLAHNPHPFKKAFANHHPFANHHGGNHPLAHKVLDKLGFREGEFKAGRIVHGIGRLAEAGGVAVGAYGLATGDQNAKNIGAAAMAGGIGTDMVGGGLVGNSIPHPGRIG